MRLRPQLANRQQIASTLGKTGNHGKSSTPAFLANSWNMPDCAGVIVWTRVRLRMFVEATMAKTSHTSRTTSRKSPTRWSAEVTRGFYPEGPRYIAASLKRSAEASRRKKAPSYRSALSMLTFYINRAGTNLSPTRRRILTRAKDELRTGLIAARNDWSGGQICGFASAAGPTISATGSSESATRNGRQPSGATSSAPVRTLR
jgi:hypothetical protein